MPLRKLRAPEGRNESDSENRQQEELGRAEGKYHRLQNGQRQTEKDRAKQTANGRGAETGAERPSGLALLGHRVTVQRRGGSRTITRTPIRNALNRTAGMHDRVHGAQKHRAGELIHIVNERNQQHEAEFSTQPRRRSEKNSHRDRHRHEKQQVWRGQEMEQRGKGHIEMHGNAFAESGRLGLTVRGRLDSFTVSGG